MATPPLSYQESAPAWREPWDRRQRLGRRYPWDRRLLQVGASHAATRSARVMGKASATGSASAMGSAPIMVSCGGAQPSGRPTRTQNWFRARVLGARRRGLSIDQRDTKTGRTAVFDAARAASYRRARAPRPRGHLLFPSLSSSSPASSLSSPSPSSLLSLSSSSSPPFVGHRLHSSTLERCKRIVDIGRRKPVLQVPSCFGRLRTSEFGLLALAAPNFTGVRPLSDNFSATSKHVFWPSLVRRRHNFVRLRPIVSIGANLS